MHYQFWKRKAKSPIPKNDFITEMNSIDEKPQFTIKKKENDDHKIIYEGEQPTENEMESL
ncbi:MAG: hypothetical protein CMI18_13980 [Opitutaceae bacterium]|nr:hypothetical protein [Opitutaceae bacterium]|tara:strand:+ start:3450 stop:3629 length:180 start_codon:yes stop_codon:yes gene_type:complete